MFRTRYFATESQAHTEYAAMKCALHAILMRLGTGDAQRDDAVRAMEQFVVDFP
jgi:hypothetical protein